VVSLRCTIRPGVVTLKGGKCSGHRGHAGRPGSVGGSVPGIAGVRNITADWKSGAAANAAKLNLSKSEVENMFTLSGLTTSIRIGSVTNGFSVSCKWHAPDGKYVGEADRAFYSIVRYGVKGESVADNIGLKFSGAFQDRGLAKSLYDRQIGQLRKAGFDSIRLEADTTIGRYAWAKKGFDYCPSLS